MIEKNSNDTNKKIKVINSLRSITVADDGISYFESQGHSATESDISALGFLKYWRRKEKEEIERVAGTRREFRLIFKEKWRGELVVSVPNKLERRCNECRNQRKEIFLSTDGTRIGERYYCSDCAWSKIYKWKEEKQLENEEVLDVVEKEIRKKERN